MAAKPVLAAQEVELVHGRPRAFVVPELEAGVGQGAEEVGPEVRRRGQAEALLAFGSGVGRPTVASQVLRAGQESIG